METNYTDLKDSDPLVGRPAVKAELGIGSDPTFYRHMQSGLIPRPDATVNGRNLWLWSNVLKAKQRLLEAS